jgi:hypothetical protein
MNRSLFLAFGFASVIVAVAGQGCSNSTSGGPTDAGHDVTNDVTTTPEAGEDSSTTPDTGTTQDAAADTGPSCPVVSLLPNLGLTLTAAQSECASSGCCTQLTTCEQDPSGACLKAAQAAGACLADGGLTQAATCVNDGIAKTDGGASATLFVEAFSCLNNCLVFPADDGGKPAADGGDAGNGDAAADAGNGDAAADAAGE